MSEIPGLDGILDVEYVELTPERVVVRWTIDTQHLQPFGIPHGGAYCAVHESTASIGGQIWLAGRGVAVGANNSTDFLRQAAVGDTIVTSATPVHCGRTQQLWRVESRREGDDKLIAQGQVRLANTEVPLPAEAAEWFGRFGDSGG